jgi:hypothetical protein
MSHCLKLNAEDGMGTYYERLGRILYSRAERRKMGRYEDWRDPLLGDGVNVVNLTVLI